MFLQRDPYFKIAFSGMVGNILEWYDFTLYGYLAAILAQVFFPSEDPIASLLASSGAFAVGFIFRPLGSIMFGYIGDKYGRKKALIISIMLMAFPTFLIGLLPTYQQIGILAPVLLIILRILQGLSTGGEYTTSVSFVVEHAPQDKRGFFGSINLLGAVIGIMFGSLMGAVLTFTIPKESLLDWGWRIGFLFGIVLAFVGLYIRRKTEETPIFLQIQQNEQNHNPLFKTVKEHYRELLIAVIFSSLQGVAFFLLFVYMPTFYSKFINIPMSTALFINTFAMFVLAVLIPVMASLSDKVGRKPLLYISTFLYTVLSPVLFYLIKSGNINVIIMSHLAFAFISSLFMSILPTVLIENFPSDVRNTAFSVGYNISLGIFGGTVPILATYLLKSTGNLISPSVYLSIVAFIVFITTFFVKESYKNRL
ncbi:MAG: MFS transporter [Hydrogenothermaceae bacterium]